MAAFFPWFIQSKVIFVVESESNANLFTLCIIMIIA